MGLSESVTCPEEGRLSRGQDSGTFTEESGWGGTFSRGPGEGVEGVWRPENRSEAGGGLAGPGFVLRNGNACSSGGMLLAAGLELRAEGPGWQGRGEEESQDGLTERPA